MREQVPTWQRLQMCEHVVAVSMWLKSCKDRLGSRAENEKRPVWRHQTGLSAVIYSCVWRRSSRAVQCQWGGNSKRQEFLRTLY